MKSGLKKIRISAESALRAIETLIAVLLLAVLMNSIIKIGNESSAEGKAHLEDSIKRCVLACYADQGVYPPDVKFLQDRYGLQINESKYIVRYEIFAENIMPEITVLERNR